MRIASLYYRRRIPHQYNSTSRNTMSVQFNDEVLRATAMPSSAELNRSVVLQLHNELQAMLKDPNVLYQTIDHHLELLRLAVTTVAINHMRDGIISEVEKILWDVNVIIKNKYKKALAKFGSDDQHKFAVEKDKLEKRYIRYIKASSHFYKGFIQRLNAHFVGITNLRKVAQRLHLSPLSIEEPIAVTPDMEDAIVQSVYQAILHLGDLARYRNELRTTNRSWTHALAYYVLAGQLVPADGTAHNQMAVLALADQNHLDAVYHLYRALTAENPYPATNNLEIEWKKILIKWTKGTRNALSTNLSPAETAATNWLLVLHAKLFRSEEFLTHDEVETEFICQTTTMLKDQSIQPEVLSKIALINIAAEYYALERSRNEPSFENKKSYFSVLRLNVRTIFMLLEVLQPEFRSEEDLPGILPRPEKFTPLMRLVLPVLRHYSIWLVAQADTISGYTFGEANSNDEDVDMPLIDNLKIHVKEMFRLYASSLCLFCTAFPPQELHEFSEVKYLLKEDAATIGFKPFTDPTLNPFCDVYYSQDGTLKPHVTDIGIEEETPEAEMTTRIKAIIRDAVAIAYNMPDTPIKLAIDQQEGVFYFIEDRLPDILPTNGHSPGHSMSSLEMKRTLSERDQARGHALGGTVLPDTEFTHDSVDRRMNDMVIELVDSREDSYGMNTRTAHDLLSGLPAENFLRSSREIQVHPREELMSSFADVTFQPSNQLLQASQPLYGQRQGIQSAQRADTRTPDRMMGGGNYAHRNSGQQFYDTPPAQSSIELPGQGPMYENRRPEVPGGIMTSSELDFHVEMFNNPFSSWRNKSDIDTGTPYRRAAPNPIQPGIKSSISPLRPSYAMGDQYSQSSPFSGNHFESSGAGMYGDSRSYEREMMLQSSLPRPSGNFGQMQTPPGGQG